jgi:serine/threonine-protein kinase
VLVLATTCETEVGWLGAQVEALEPLAADVVEKVCRTVTSSTNPASTLPQELARAAPMTPLRLELALRAIAAGIRAPREAVESDLVRLRLRELDAETMELLQMAACLGERFLDSDLEDLLRSEAGGVFRAAGIDGSPAEEQLASLHELGLLISIGNGERVFAHRLIHEIVYLSASEPRRELLHALASSSSRVARRQIAVRANHLVRAGASNAVAALTEAARAAERSFDDLAAADAVHAAIGLSRAQPESSVRRSVEIDLVVLANRVMRSEDAASQAIALIEVELRRRHNPADEPRLLTALGVQLTRLRRWDEAAAAFRRAIAPCLALGDRAALLAVYREIGQMYAKKGQPEDAVRELKEGLDMITLGEGPRAQIDWRYLLELSEIMRRSARLPDAQRWCEHALWQAERTGDRLGLLRCHAQIAWVLRDSKQMALAEQHLARALAEARHFGDRLTTAELLIERARARAARGRLAEAQRCCEEALRLARGIRWAAGVEHAQRAIRGRNRHRERGRKRHRRRLPARARGEPRLERELSTPRAQRDRRRVRRVPAAESVGLASRRASVRTRRLGARARARAPSRLC